VVCWRGSTKSSSSSNFFPLENSNLSTIFARVRESSRRIIQAVLRGLKCEIGKTNCKRKKSKVQKEISNLPTFLSLPVLRSLSSQSICTSTLYWHLHLNVFHRSICRSWLLWRCFGIRDQSRMDFSLRSSLSECCIDRS